VTSCVVSLLRPLKEVPWIYAVDITLEMALLHTGHFLIFRSDRLAVVFTLGGPRVDMVLALRLSTHERF
jgi:hypothetical protein